MNITKLKDRSSTATVEYGGQKASLQYRPDGVNAREWRQLRKQNAAADPDDPDSNANVALLARMLTGWDLVVDSGKAKEPYPLTKENLDALPPALLDAMVSAIVKDLYPEAPSATPTGSFA